MYERWVAVVGVGLQRVRRVEKKKKKKKKKKLVRARAMHRCERLVIDRIADRAQSHCHWLPATEKTTCGAHTLHVRLG